MSDSEYELRLMLLGILILVATGGTEKMPFVFWLPIIIVLLALILLLIVCYWLGKWLGENPDKNIITSVTLITSVISVIVLKLIF